MESWWAAAPALVVGLLAIVAPGAPLVLALRLRGVAALAMTVAASVAVVATTGIVAELAGVPFGPLPVAGTAALGTLVCLAIGVRVRPPLPDPRRRAAVAVILAALVTTALVGTVAFGAVASPELVSQTYDGVFHLNAAAAVLADGRGSSLTLYSLNHPGDDLEFYPAAWHDLVALVSSVSGASIPVATNSVWIVSSGFGTATGAAFLAQTLLPSAWRRGVAWISALLAGASTAAPYLLLQWGTLYPTGLAMAILPTGLALVVLALRRRTVRSRSFALLAPALIWLVAAALAHPRTLPTLAVLAAPAVLARVGAAVLSGLRDPGRRRRTVVLAGAGVASALVLAAVAAFVVLRYFGADERPISDRLNGGPATARQTIGESVAQVLLLAPPLGPQEIQASASILIAVLVLGGLVLLIRQPGVRWVVVSYALVGLLYVLAAGSNDDFAKLATGLWYKDKYRLFAALGTLVPVLAAYAVVTAASPLRRLPRLGARSTPFLAAALAAACFAVAVLSPGLADSRAAVGQVFAVGAAKDGALLDRDTFELLESLDETVPAGSLVVGNPWNGSSLSGPLGHREALFPHFTGEWDPDRAKVLQAFQWVASDGTVCEALDRLDAHYFVASPGLLWNGDAQAIPFEGLDRAVGAPGLTEVERVGDAVLYRISACD